MNAKQTTYVHSQTYCTCHRQTQYEMPRNMLRAGGGGGLVIRNGIHKIPGTSIGASFVATAAAVATTTTMKLLLHYYYCTTDTKCGGNSTPRINTRFHLKRFMLVYEYKLFLPVHAFLAHAHRTAQHVFSSAKQEGKDFVSPCRKRKQIEEGV